MQLKDQVAIVTGGAQGLGEAFARRMAQEGAVVVVADLQEKNAETVAASIREAGGTAQSMAIDVLDIGRIDQMAAQVMKDHGAIDILVNSAGVFDVMSIEGTTEEIWDRTLSINLKGTFFASKAVVPMMKEKGYGRIVNLTSIAGLGGFLNCPAYCASKGGIVNLTKALACELAPHGITVNAIAPGPVETPINKMFDFDNPRGDAHRKWLRERTPSETDFFKVEDITGTALYLVARDSHAITGVIIPVDGGWCAW